MSAYGMNRVSVFTPEDYEKENNTSGEAFDSVNEFEIFQLHEPDISVAPILYIKIPDCVLKHKPKEKINAVPINDTELKYIEDNEIVFTRKIDVVLSDYLEKIFCIKEIY